MSVRFRALLLALGLSACSAPAPSDGSSTESPAASEQETSESADGATSATPDKPNIIVFLTDTQRQDRLSVYGAGRETSPFFDQFAGDNFLFENAYAPTSWTRPSVASLFTGTYPQRHGVQMRQDILPSGIPTLAESLLDEGWRTYILNTNPHITDAWGMTRGFEHTVHLMPHPDQFKAGNGANSVLRHIRQIMPEIEEPFFLYVHMIDPHYPFEPPEKDLEALGLPTKNPNSMQRYDGEIRYVDRHLRTMMTLFDEAGFLEHSLVMMTSDHGDEFHDHGSMGHGKTLYQEVVKIPMALGVSQSMRHLVAGVGEDETITTCPRIRENVSLVDVMPTVLELVGVDGPSISDGRSLVQLMRCEPYLDNRPIFFSVEKERTSLAAILVDSSKLIVDRTTGIKRLYLLDENPREQRVNLGRREGMQELKRNLAEMLETFEWSVKPGLHVELAGLDDQKDRRRFIVRLSTEGRITDVQSHSFEPRDRFVLSKDRKTLRIDSKLTSFWHRSPKHVWVQDRDELFVAIDPPDAPITVFAELDGKAAPGMQLRFPAVAKTSADWPVTLSHDAMRSTAGLVDRRQPGLYFFVQEKPKAQHLETVSREITEALRVLGYIE